MDAALIGIQLEVGHDVLASAESYRAHIASAMAAAMAEAGPAEGSLVVFPEMAGHLALYALAPAAARKARTLAAALASAAVRRPLEVLRGVTTTRLLDARHAVIAALAPDGERFWKSVFGPLARQHAAYVVAGSHLRLGPDGELTNASLVFDPRGRLLATTEKVNLVPGVEDGARGGLALARGDAERLPVVETPLGRLATLVGYDAFRAPHTRVERFVALGPGIHRRGGVAIAANPSVNLWPWHERWRFAADGETRTRAAQWDADGLRGALADVPFARLGVTAHLVGGVLDLTFEGCSEIVERVDAEVRVLVRAGAHDRAGHVHARATC